jgi:aldehyde dehydrogenase (NAD+)
MSIIPFDGLDEVIERGNKTMYGLAAAVWTKDITKATAIANGLRAGTVWVNCYDVFDAAAPFGGFKQSGIGRELGEYWRPRPGWTAAVHRGEDGNDETGS